MEADNETREKIKKVLLDGRVVISDKAREAFANMDLGNPNRKSDFTITDVQLSCWGPFNKKDGTQNNKGGFSVSWQTKSSGFGETVIYIDNDGELRCQDEGMGKEFLKNVLNKLLEKVKIDD